MEKKLLQTFFITFLFLMGYGLITSRFFPSPSRTPAPTSPSPTTEVLEKKLPPEQVTSNNEEKNLPEVTMGDFIVTYSPRGGYIKKISLKNYGEESLFKNLGFVPQEENKEFVPTLSADKIIFLSAAGQQKEFIFAKDIIKIKLSSAPPAMVLFSNPLSNNALEQGYQEAFSFYNNDFQRKNLKSIKVQSEISLNGVQFAGFRDRYLCLSLLKGTYNITWEKKANEIYLLTSSPNLETVLYLGPQTEAKLKKYELQNIINYGFFHGIGAGLSWLLHFFYNLTKSWGVSIILFAVFVYIVLLPFTMKSTKAMKKMAEVQPEVEVLRKKHRDNPQKLNKETLELYKRYKINPLGGCLPMLFQFPVFIALYQVLLRFVELKGTSFLWIKDLALPDHAFKLPFPAPLDYINILPIFIAILGLLQQKVVSVSSASPEQKKMGMFFALFMGVIFYNFPASLNLYWAIQNLLTFAYQMRVGKIRHLPCPEQAT